MKYFVLIAVALALLAITQAQDDSDIAEPNSNQNLESPSNNGRPGPHGNRFGKKQFEGDNYSNQENGPHSNHHGRPGPHGNRFGHQQQHQEQPSESEVSGDENLDNGRRDPVKSISFGYNW